MKTKQLYKYLLIIGGSMIPLSIIMFVFWDLNVYSTRRFFPLCHSTFTILFYFLDAHFCGRNYSVDYWLYNEEKKYLISKLKTKSTLSSTSDHALRSPHSQHNLLHAHLLENQCSLKTHSQFRHR